MPDPAWDEAWESFEARFGVTVTSMQERNGRMVVGLAPGHLDYCDDFHDAETGEPTDEHVGTEWLTCAMLKRSLLHGADAENPDYRPRYRPMR